MTATIGDNSTPQFTLLLITSGRRCNRRRCNKRWILHNIMITSLILVAQHHTNTVFASKPVRSFIGRRRSRQVVSGSNIESEEGTSGLTLGDLDEIMQSNKDGDGIPILGPNILFGQSNIIASKDSQQQQHQSGDYNQQPTHDNANSDNNNNQILN